MKNQLLSLLKSFLGLPLSIIAFFFIGKLIIPQLGTIFSHNTEINYTFLTIGMLCFFIYYGIRAYVWYLLLDRVSDAVSFKNACFFWSSSELKRYIPGNIWSFIGRTASFSEVGVQKKTIAKNLFIEAELLVIGAGVVSLLAFPFLLSWNILLLDWMIPFVYVGIFAIISLFIFSKYITPKSEKKISKLFRLFLPDKTPARLFFFVCVSALSFLFFGLGHYFIFASFLFINPQLVWQLSGFAVLSFLIGYLSLITPSGFGVREGVLIVGLAKIMSVSNAAFASLFSRILLIISELLFIGASYLWHKTHNKFVRKAEVWIRSHKQLSVVMLLFLFFIAYFIPTSFLRYDNYYTGKYDLGNMSQTVWNTTQGRIFQFTNPDTAENVSRLAVHADFLLIFFAPFYTLFPDPRTLLFLQVLIVGAGVFFVYLLAKEITKSPHLALAFSFVYVINPSVERSILYDFHAATLATTFFLAAWYFMIKKRLWFVFLFLLLAGLCKEQLWLIVGLFGIVLFFYYKKRVLGISLLVFGISFSYFLISYAIPQSLGSKHFALSYFSDFGDNPKEIVQTIIFSPQKTFSVVFSADRISYLKQLFAPLGYLSLFAPLVVAISLPEFGINLLSNNAQLHQIYYQYTASITPFLFIAAMYGIVFLQKVLHQCTQKDWSAVVITYLLISSCIAAYRYGPLPGAKEANIDMFTKQLAERKMIDSYLQTVPSDVIVLASNRIAAHLSNREDILVSPVGLEKAEYVILFLDSRMPDATKGDAQLVATLKKDKKYTINFEKGSFIVFQKK